MPPRSQASSPPPGQSIADACFTAMIRHTDRQKLATASKGLVGKLQAEAAARDQPTAASGSNGNGGQPPMPPDVFDDEIADLAWGARAAAIEMFGTDDVRFTKRVFNQYAKFKAERRINPNCPNPGFVVLPRCSTVILSRRAFRAFIAAQIRGGRS